MTVTEMVKRESVYRVYETMSWKMTESQSHYSTASSSKPTMHYTTVNRMRRQSLSFLRILNFYSVPLVWSFRYIHTHTHTVTNLCVVSNIYKTDIKFLPWNPRRTWNILRNFQGDSFMCGLFMLFFFHFYTNLFFLNPQKEKHGLFPLFWIAAEYLIFA